MPRPCITLLDLLLPGLLCAQEHPRYVFINKAPGAEWDAGRPETFTRAGFDEITARIDAPDNPHLRLGVSFVFDYLRYDLGRVAESLARFLDLAEVTGVPVLVNLDGMNWWEARPDLWNWWEPDRPGYDPANRMNVEWCGWGPEHAVKIGWRNWGAQIRVAPMMNIASPRVVAAHREALCVLLPIVKAWHDALPESGKWLLGGVKLGHEASIGVNAWYYPDGNRYLDAPADRDPTHGFNPALGWHGGLQPIGYAAVTAAGLKRSGTLTREDIARVVGDYLAMLCREAQNAGFPPELVYTHQGGTYAPWEKHMPWTPALNPHATPGWSFYGVDPREARGLGDVLARGKGRWAAAEWWWGAPDSAGWRRHFEATLNFHDCQFVAVYNWNCGFRFRESPDGIEGLRACMAAWREPEPGGSAGAAN